MPDIVCEKCGYKMSQVSEEQAKILKGRGGPPDRFCRRCGHKKMKVR
jgi:C4-type Zn-finger protein